MKEDIVKNYNGKPVTTSRAIAWKFGKQHKDVLRTIDNLECSDEFGERNFAPTYYTDKWNRKQKEYIITKDGFSFLVMGFTGREAAKFKEDFINAFNLMEERINGQLDPSKLSRLEILQMAMEAEREKQALQEANTKLQSKADYLNKITGSEGAIDIGQAAKILKIKDENGKIIGRNKLFRMLREESIFFKNKNEPKQKFIESGYFLLKEQYIKDIDQTMLKVLVTQKGLERLNRKFSGELFKPLKLAL
jgi:anti-repressor protein